MSLLVHAASSSFFLVRLKNGCGNGEGLECNGKEVAEYCSRSKFNIYSLKECIDTQSDSVRLTRSGTNKGKQNFCAIEFLLFVSLLGLRGLSTNFFWQLVSWKLDSAILDCHWLRQIECSPLTLMASSFQYEDQLLHEWHFCLIPLLKFIVAFIVIVNEENSNDQGEALCVRIYRKCVLSHELACHLATSNHSRVCVCMFVNREFPY